MEKPTHRTLIPVFLQIVLPDGLRTVWGGVNIACVITALTLKFIFFFQAMKISYLPQPFLSIMDSRKQYSLGFLYSISSFLLNPPFLRDLSIVIESVCSFLFQCILST